MLLTKEQIENNKTQFISLLRETDKDKESMDKLIAFLETSDFFSAPSSARYHGNYEGGLCQHSLNVFNVALKNASDLDLLSEGPDDVINIKGQEKYNRSTIIISTLLHDLCKVNLYKPQECWFKNEFNRWESYPGYKKEYQFPYGHGEYSVELLRSFIKLNRAEMLAIRWHMGFFDPGVIFPGETKFAFDEASKRCPLVTIVLTADYLASQLLEPTFEPQNKK